MPGVFDYSTTAASNTTVGGVSIAEGMAPGNVNNAIRAEMADARKWQLDWSGVTTAGAGNAYTLTSNQGISAYADGMRFSFRADRANTGASTLNVDGRGAKSIRRMDGSAAVALVSGDLIANGVYDVVYVLADDVFVVVNSFGTLPGLTATIAELNYMDGVTSAVQTQLNAKQASDATLTSLSGLTLAAGDILYATAADTLTNLAKGTDGHVLSLASGVPAWAVTPGWTLVSSSSTWTGGKQTVTGLGGYRRVMVALVLGAADAADERILRVGDAGGILSTGIYQRNQGAALTRATLSHNNVTATQSSTIVIEEFNGTGPYKPIIGAPYRNDDTAVGVLTSSALTQIEVSNETGNITSGTLYVWGMV